MEVEESEEEEEFELIKYEIMHPVKAAKIYGFFMIILMVFISLQQETFNRTTSLNRFIRGYLGLPDLLDYLASDPLNMPFDEEVQVCDYRTMDTKEFFNEYVVKHRPCLFKEYGRLNAAYNNWQNETYLREKASDHIIYAERQTNNRFAYYTEGAKRVYMSFGDFLDKF